MKTFVVLVLTVTALFLWQRNGTQTTATSPKSEAKTMSQSSSRPASEGDWAKQSIDRAREVAGEVQASRRENRQP